MASLVYNEGARQLQSGGSVDYAADTIEIVLVKSTYTPNKDDSGATAMAGEITGVSGYAGGFGGAGRKALGTKTITKDTTNDRIVYDAADPSAWTLGAGDTIGGAVISKKGSADDTTAVPLFFLDFTDVPTNGSTFTIQFNAGGIAYTQQ
jgi:hypothetical protein